MRFLRPRWHISALALALLAHSVFADTTRQEFTAAQAQWKAAGLRDYAFTLVRHCFCRGVQPVRITVKDGVVHSARNVADDSPVDSAIVVGLPSMDGILQKIEDAYAKPADQITLTLNPRYGYPERVFIDYYKIMADEELIYEIRDFTP